MLNARTTVELNFDGKRRRRSVLSQTFDITLIADEIIESDEFFLVELSTEDASVVVVTPSATIVIINDDSKT